MSNPRDTDNRNQDPGTQNQNEQAGTTAPGKKSSRKSILALSILALGINSTAAVYTLSPNDFALPNVANLTLPDFSRLAELLPQPKASDRPGSDAGRAEGNPVDPGETLRHAAGE